MTFGFKYLAHEGCLVAAQRLHTYYGVTPMLKLKSNVILTRTNHSRFRSTPVPDVMFYGANARLRGQAEPKISHADRKRRLQISVNQLICL